MLIVNCGSNKLAALDLSGLEKLTSLGCYNNNLTTLDTSKLPEMSFLECYANSLTTLDLTTNSKIATLHCQNNLLKTLKIETCQNLTFSDIFLPQCLSQFMIGLISRSYLLDTGIFNTEIQFVLHPFFTHALRNHAVHEKTEFRLDIFNRFVYIIIHNKKLS